MNIKETVNNLLTPEQKASFAKIFKFDVAPVITPTNQASPVEPAMPTEKKLQDGTTIKSDTPVIGIGSVITVVSPDGELPIPDGEYVLDNGDNFVTVAGVVSEYEAAAAEAVEPVEAPMATDATVESRLAAVEQMCKDIKTKMDSMQMAATPIDNTPLFAAQEAQIDELKEKFSAFGVLFSDITALPMADPIVAPSNKPLSKSDKLIEKFNRKNK